MDQRTKTDLVIQAIRNLSKNEAQFGLVNGEISSLDWHPQEIPKPSDSAIEAEFEKLKSEWELKDYSRKRIEKYPSTDDLIVALWEKVIEGRSESANALEIKRQQVKTAHPKPL